MVVNKLSWDRVLVRVLYNFNVKDRMWVFSPVAMGRALVGLAPPKQSSNPPKLKYETVKSVEFLLNLNVNASMHKCKAPLLVTFWQWFYEFHKPSFAKVLGWKEVMRKIFAKYLLPSLVVVDV